MMKYDLKYDFHTHVLPGIDDGARDLPASLSMLSRLQAQGIDTVVATPHFYAHRQEAAQFLENRAAALAAVKSAGDSLPTVLPAAEVCGISIFAPSVWRVPTRYWWKCRMPGRKAGCWKRFITFA